MFTRRGHIVAAPLHAAQLVTWCILSVLSCQQREL